MLPFQCLLPLLCLICFFTWTGPTPAFCYQDPSLAASLNFKPRQLCICHAKMKCFITPLGGPMSSGKDDSSPQDWLVRSKTRCILYILSYVISHPFSNLLQQTCHPFH